MFVKTQSKIVCTVNYFLTARKMVSPLQERYESNNTFIMKKSALAKIRAASFIDLHVSALLSMIFSCGFSNWEWVKKKISLVIDSLSPSVDRSYTCRALNLEHSFDVEVSRVYFYILCTSKYMMLKYSKPANK